MKLSLILLLLFASSSWANGYKRGNQVCSDYQYAEEVFKQDSEDISNQYMYASCLVIKGQDATGLARLYHLADHNSDIRSSQFLGNYFSSDGQFTNHLTKTTIEEALKYYFRTLALMDLYPNYPGEDFIFYELEFQAELNSSYLIPVLYLEKYLLGSQSDSCKRAIQYGYQGECPTYEAYDYEFTTIDSLNEALRYAKECANLPQKRHFDPKHYQAATKSCANIVELVLNIIPLEKKRQELLLREDCKDPINCEKFMSNHNEIVEILKKSIEKRQKAFEGV